MEGQAYNVGLSNANLSKLELTEKIKEYVPNFYVHCADIGSDPDKRNYIVSNKKIEDIGFRTQYTLDHGIQEVIKYCHMMPRSSGTNY